MRIKYLFAFIFFLILSVFVVRTTQIQASNLSTNNIYGFAWSSNIGWISFNRCPDAASYTTKLGCNGTIDYGVSVDSTGLMHGYAWSSNVGWISFENSSGCPVAPCNSPKVDLNTGNITGWAQVVGQVSPDGNKSSWIALSSNDANDTLHTWGLRLNSIKGEIEGFAWDNNMLGWISANCSNLGTCPISSYALKLNFQLTDPTITLSANPAMVPVGGGSTILTWTSTGELTGCATSSFTPALPVTPNGSSTVTVNVTTLFGISCKDSSGKNISDEVTVYVDTGDITVTVGPSTNGTCPVSWYSSTSCALSPDPESSTSDQGNWTATIKTGAKLTISCAGKSPTTVECKAPAIKIKPHYQEQ